MMIFILKYTTYLTISQTTNFRPFQIEKACRRQLFSKVKMMESSPKGKKNPWEKEKLLVTSIFFFSQSVFKRHVLQTCKNQGFFGKGLKPFVINHSQASLCFTCLEYKSFENIVGKGAISPFPSDSVFYPF